MTTSTSPTHSKAARPLLSMTALAVIGAWGALAGSAAQAAPRLTVRADTAVAVEIERVQWQLEGPFAEQHWYVTLRNPSSRPVEATLNMPLESDQRLRGYALDIDGVLREAVPVERVKARVAFEDTVRGRVDPALIEQDAGNAYHLRVFPVPAGGVRRVRLDIASLAERTACGWQHALSAATLPAATAVPLEISSLAKPVQGPKGLVWQGGGSAAAAPRVQHARWAGWSRAAGEVKLCLAAPAGTAVFRGAAEPLAAGVAPGEAEAATPAFHWVEQAALVSPGASAAATRARPLGRRLEVVWDASLGMPEDRSAEWALLRRYLAGRDVEVTLTVLRQDQQRQHFSVKGGEVSALEAALKETWPDGATALRQWRPEAGVDEVLMFTDAVSTWPTAAGEALAAPVPGVPVFVIGTAIGDPALAQAWVHQSGAVIELGRLSAEQAWARLTQAPLQRWSFGPQATGWQVPSYTPQLGALRACHVSPAGAAGAVAAPAAAALDAVGVSSAQAQAATGSALAAYWCAAWWVDSLQTDPDAHRSQLARLGRQFGVPNAETDLLVLERTEDYVRHGIVPRQADPALREAVQRAVQQREVQRAREVAENRRSLEAGWQQRRQWWSQSFPKDELPPVKPQPKMAVPMPAPMAMPAPVAAAAAPMVMAELADVRRREGSARMAPAGASAATPTPPVSMSLRSVAIDAPYAARLREARDADSLMKAYRDLRPDQARSPAFFFDVADRLFELGDAVRAQRVLSNIVEMLPRDHAALRLVAYRLQQAGAAPAALALLERVRLLAPDEPQSWRDLGLARAQQQDCPGALSALAEVVNQPWSPRFADIGLIALAELNDLSTRCPDTRVATSLDPGLRDALPVGLRVVLKWDLNDTDIDLHVTDPNGEMAYYAHRRTYQGGQMSRDFTAGYGPEEFILRDPKPGRYKVEVNYFGSRRAKLSRGVVLNVTLQTGFGTPQVSTQTLTTRLLEGSGRVLVGSFDVAPAGAGAAWSGGAGR